MSKVIVDKQKIDLLANAISAKSGEPLTMTLDEMVEAVDGIEEGGGEPNLQVKTYTVDSAGTETITADNGYDGMSSVSVSVPQGEIRITDPQGDFYTESNTRKWHVRSSGGVWSGDSYGQPGFIADYTWIQGDYTIHNAVPSNTTITPTESSQTIGGANYMMEGAVTVNAIPSNYVGSGITQRSSTDLTASGAMVTAPAGYYSSSASVSVSSGTEGTPSATKGTVSNHAVSVTPSVTNSAGYISGGTHTGTAVSVSASELVSGNLPITQNGTGIDVTNYSTVSVDVQGGGSSGMQIATKTATPSSASASISFTGLSGEPTSFVVTSDSELATGASPYKTAMVVFDGTNVIGQYITNTNNAQVTYDASGYSKSYSNGNLTITGTNANFQANQYTLVYTYGGTASNIDTKDVQVGSGATSITFTGLEDEPDYWSCIFKSNFSTSSGYQRVIAVVYDGTSTYGLAMDSSAKFSDSHWSSSYSNGSLTITSSGTNAGGYFHQPGYYQLTYAISGDQSLQTKTVTPTEQTQNVTADTAQGYTALKKVVVNPIPSSYVQPTATQGATTYWASTSAQTISSGTYLTGAQTIAAVSQTNLSADNIKSGTTVTISNGSTNIFSVLGTYTGSGGGVGTLLTTYSMGTISTSSTNATDTGKSISVSDVNDYDLLIVETSVNTVTNNRHTATVGLIFLTASSTVGTKNGAGIATMKWNSRISSNGTTTTRQGTTAYGIYPNSCSVATSNNVTTATIPMYQRYNSTSTGTINGNYTTRVYGVNLYDLIGG